MPLAAYEALPLTIGVFCSLGCASGRPWTSSDLIFLLLFRQVGAFRTERSEVLGSRDSRGLRGPIHWFTHKNDGGHVVPGY